MIRVLGIGSPDGADQVGWRVVEALRGRVDPDVELLALDRPGAALIRWMDGVDRLLLIDALVDGGPPGRVLQPSAAELDNQRALSSHEQSLVETLRLAATLGCRPSEVRLYAISVDPTRADGGVPAATIEQLAGRLACLLPAAGERPGNGVPPADRRPAHHSSKR